MGQQSRAEMARLLPAQRKFGLYPMDGGPRGALSGIEPGESVICWSGDGKYLFVTNEGVIPVRGYRIEC